MASKAKKRKRAAKRKSLKKKSATVGVVSKKNDEGVGLARVKKGLVRSLFSSLMALGVILAVYFLRQRGAN